MNRQVAIPYLGTVLTIDLLDPRVFADKLMDDSLFAILGGVNTDQTHDGLSSFMHTAI